uniref:Uncharacterized protein n=1 Tax=Meloidogyne enterolobii TaxID=390850 RepID=A0A6V7W2I8_MELEN|nr:unnamed protein product [Meloidogyne enterolobii]
MLNWWNTDGQNSSTIHPEESAGQVQHIPNVPHLLAPPSTPIGSVAATPVHGSPVRNFDHTYYGTTSNQFGNRTFTPNDAESPPYYTDSEWFPSSGGTSFAPSAVNSPTHPNMPTSLHHQNLPEDFHGYYSQQLEDESYDGDSSYVSNVDNEFDGTDTGAQHNFHMMPGSSSTSAHRKGKKHSPNSKRNPKTNSPTKSKNSAKVRGHRHLNQP